MAARGWSRTLWRAEAAEAIAGAPDPLLRLFVDGKPRTRAEVIAATGHARSTVTQRLDVLQEQGLLRLKARGPSTGGRRPSAYGLDPSARAIVAVDLGPSHLRVALVDLALTIVNDATIYLDTTQEPEDVLERALELAEQVATGSAAPVAGIGVSLPMPLAANSRPVRPPLMPGWDGYDVVGHLTARSGLPVTVDRQNYVVPLAEMARNPGENTDFLMVSFSTWVGAGAVIDGRLVRGAQNAAGHIGHVVGPWPDRDACACGNQGCLEAVASGQAILRNVGREVEATTTRDLVRLANSGNTTVLNAVRESGRKLGLVLAGYVSVINPAKIVLSGTLAEAGFELLNGVRETLYANAFPMTIDDLVVTIAETGPDAAILGAGTLALERFLASGELVDARVVSS